MRILVDLSDSRQREEHYENRCPYFEATILRLPNHNIIVLGRAGVPRQIWGKSLALATLRRLRPLETYGDLAERRFSD